MIIRRMTLEDADSVAEIEKLCFGSEAWSAKAYRDTLVTSDALYLVAEENDTIVGMCGVINAAGDGDVMNVGVHPAYRQQGIARRMLESLFAQGKEFGVEAFTLEVRAGNMSAISLYESMGFENAGIRKKFYSNPVEDAVIMWKREE